MDSGKLHVVQFSRSSIFRCLSDSLFILAQPIPFCQPFFQKFFREFSADFCLLPCFRSLCCSLTAPALRVLDYITTPFSFCQLLFSSFLLSRQILYIYHGVDNKLQSFYFYNDGNAKTEKSPLIHCCLRS